MVYPMRSYLRPFAVGDRIYVPPSGHTPRLGIGARRKGYAQAAMVVAGAGLSWHAKCVGWQYGAIYEIVRPAYNMSRHD